jgi:hypothetical protein
MLYADAHQSVRYRLAGDVEGQRIVFKHSFAFEHWLGSMLLARDISRDKIQMKVYTFLNKTSVVWFHLCRAGVHRLVYGESTAEALGERLLLMEKFVQELNGRDEDKGGCLKMEDVNKVVNMLFGHGKCKGGPSIFTGHRGQTLLDTRAQKA